MFYYRRKILLALIQRFNGEILSTFLQKDLFLVTRYQKEKSYDFIPYKYGCYSLLANQDLEVLTNLGYLEKRKKQQATQWISKSEDNYIQQLKPEDISAINHIFNTFQKYSLNELIHYTYINYPYWAINSNILDEILNPEEKQKIISQKKVSNLLQLFTIGYEGLTLEKYINKLIINDIKLLCDVRKNSYSQKWGFSKAQLKDACEKVGIKYIHIPQLGIESEERQKLTSFTAYKNLFSKYEKTTLKANWEYLLKVSELLQNNKRIALTCFEKDIQMCHRGVVAKALMELPELKEYKLQHL